MEVDLAKPAFDLFMHLSLLAKFQRQFPKTEIKPLPESHALILKGKKSDVFPLKSHIEKVESESVARSFNIPASLKKYICSSPDLPESKQVKQQFDAIVSNSTVLLTPKGKAAVALRNDHIEGLERDLIMLDRQTSTPNHSAEPIKLGPVIDEREVTVYDLSKSNAVSVEATRYLRTTSKAKEMLNDVPFNKAIFSDLHTIESEQHTQIAAQLQMEPDRQTLKIYPDLQLHLTCELGHAVHSTTRSDDSSTTPQPAQTLFLTNQPPFLYQHFAYKTLIPTANTRTLPDSSTGQRLTKEIHLHTDLASKQPSIRILLSCLNENNHITEIDILEVSLLLQSRTQIISTPSLAMDLNLKADLIVPIFKRDTALNQCYAPFLAELASTLTRSAFGKTKWSQTAKLDPSLLTQQLTQGQIKESQPKKKPRKGGETGKILFAVEVKPFSSISAISYDTGMKIGPGRKLYIENLIYSSPEDVHIPARQVWQLTDRPILHTPEKRDEPTEEQLVKKLRHKIDATYLARSLSKMYSFVQSYDRFARVSAIKKTAAFSRPQLEVSGGTSEKGDGDDQDGSTTQAETEDDQGLRFWG